MIDLIHDIAGGFRELIQAVSYPGTICSVNDYIKKIDRSEPFYPSTMLFVYMLLDSEVTFYVVGEERKKAEEMVSKMTYSKAAGIEETDYIFILNNSSDAQKKEVMEKAKTGDLIDPHKSASIIIETASLMTGESMFIQGPGIKDINEIRVDFFPYWEEARKEKNIEFPMGIDMYFIDSSGNILALPRTSKVRGSE
jgi:alpha-D-ribose 1-methylphosphonate 5-triphosphate synthase subunit PhnH